MISMKFEPPEFFPMWDEDEWIMRRIATELDMDPVERQMRAFGFAPVFVSPRESRFVRCVAGRVQSFRFALDEDGRCLHASLSEDGTKDREVHAIRSWDEWIVFVRLQAYRTLMLRAAARLPQASPAADKPVTIDLVD